MVEKFLFGGASWAEAKSSLAAGTLRQRVAAQNIAQAGTPGYRAQEVKFEELLAAVQASASDVKQTRPGHLSPKSTDRVPRPQMEFSADPRVDIEKEMVSLNENAIHYKAVAQMAARRYRGLRNAIRTEG